MEQTSITKKLYLTLGFALLGAVLALAFPGEMTYETFAAPVNALGQALRGLSLSGTGGNIAAWAITLVVSLLPLLPFLLLRRKRKATEDWVLLLLIPQLFALIYYAVNPTLIDSLAAPFLPVGQLGVILATAVTWLVLAFLRAMAEAPGERLAAAVILALTVNLLQLATFSLLVKVDFQVELNLLPLALAGAMFLLSRWMRQGLALREDNDSII